MLILSVWVDGPTLLSHDRDVSEVHLYFHGLMHTQLSPNSGDDTSPLRHCHSSMDELASDPQEPASQQPEKKPQFTYPEPVCSGDAGDFDLSLDTSSDVSSASCCDCDVSGAADVSCETNVQ